MTSRGTTHSTMQASIPMSLFASWDIDRSSANCIPRVCSVNVTRLVVLHELDKDCQSVFVAAKMQHSKRTLRSNEIDFVGNSPTSLNTHLELIFSIQYPHFVKRDQNRLQLLLQRRKRYKNRAMLGYKTLAMAVVDMEELIQCPRNDESILQLYSTNKDASTDTTTVAQIFVKSLSSLPLNIDPDGYRLEKTNGADRSPDVDNYSEDEVDSYSSDGASDVGPDYGDDVVGRKMKSRRRKVRMSTSSRQQNFIKTKVTAILRKFKQGLGEEIAQQSELPGDDQDVNLDFLYDELEDFNTSDSCPDLDDTVSVVSTPKPKIRPFFDRTSHSSSTNELNNLKYKSTLTLHSESNFPATETENSMDRTSHSPSRNSNLTDNEDEISSIISNVSDRKHHHHQTTTMMSSSSQYSNNTNTKENKKELKELSESLKDAFIDDKLPAMVVIADGGDKFAVQIATYIHQQPSSSYQYDSHVFITKTFTDIRSVFSTLLNRLQTNVNSSSKSFSPVKILIVGAESFFNQILRQYVERMSGRSPDLQNLVVFYILPYANHAISRHLTSVDCKYSSNFNDHLWRDGILSGNMCSGDGEDEQQRTLQLVNRIKQYINDGNDVLHVCISEVMLTFRQAGNGGDEGPSQKFIPFVSDVKVGVNDSPSSTFDSDREDGIIFTTNSPSMQPISSQLSNLPLSPSASTTVANSPTVMSSLSSSGNNQSLLQHLGGSGEIKLGLQVDYWKDKDQNKCTLKSNFKSFLVSCQHSCGGNEQNHSQLVLDVVTKGKKNLMRLPGKKPKERESESKSQEIGSISRLICASKHQHTVLRVTIDSVEWKDVKFFQISSTWSSHIKTLPVAIFS